MVECDADDVPVDVFGILVVKLLDELLPVAVIGICVELPNVELKSVELSGIGGNWVIQLAIWAEIEGSFHHGLTEQAGADVVAFIVVVVVAPVPSHRVTVPHDVVQVSVVKTVPLEVRLEQIAVQEVYVPDEQELDTLEVDLAVVDTDEGLLNRLLPVVHGGPVQLVIGIVDKS